jgi:hypothetical protein
MCYPARQAQMKRGHGEDSIYFDAANNCFTGAVSLGHGPDGSAVAAR